MKTIWCVAVAAVASLLAGCGGSDASTGEGESALTGDHFKAAHCEVFVDRVAPFFAEMNVSQLTIYLKTPVDKLRWSGRREVRRALRPDHPGRPTRSLPGLRGEEIPELGRLLEAHPRHVRRAARSVAHVQGSVLGRGQRRHALWVNASEGGQDFVLDSNMLSNLQKQRAPGFFSTNGSTSPNVAVAPADQFPYLNAQRCR